MRALEIHETESIKPIMVRPVIDKLIHVVQPETSTKQNIIINEVSPLLQMDIDEDKLALVVGNLMRDLVGLAQDDYLYIIASGKDEITMQLKNTNLSRNRTFVVSLDTIMMIAEQLGITMTIEDNYCQGTDLSVNFLSSQHT